MKEYVVKAQGRSTDELRVRKYLDEAGVKYTVSDGVFGGLFVRFEADKALWKRVKKDLNLEVESMYCTFKELLE